MEHAVFEGAKSAIVLFDGECNFCNSGVWMMISNSEARNLRFCAQNVRESLRILLRGSYFNRMTSAAGAAAFTSSSNAKSHL